ncbi:precorrin-2 dehydrogenase/sirohydrochlorin ferrochelatase family protein [Paenibacillus kobensis]|uniref:precorrin-2 dehydrogenase/sirohydrochlorin ferrochelatase family protein n=1 Tax=Paenibacillus kobensis TaxID=59841 RepID=UPI0013E2FCC5|nr:bifunctional precorrin-2 dehydrogenase/sirohydrochlorin ferrochelatase [Paenibacillus kobensis]
MSGNESGLYPVMLRLTGKRCIVVGGGPVAQRKVASLLDAGADGIIVISDRLTETLDEWVEAGRIRVLRRHYQEGDLADAALVIAATNNPNVNMQVADDAQRLRIWANTADDGASGDLVTPAVVRRGDLIVALTTGGASPALAARLKQQLEQLLGSDYEPRLRVLRLLRERLLDRSAEADGRCEDEQLDTARRRLLLRAAAEDEWGWRTVAAMLPETFSSTDESANHLLHTKELRGSLDHWIKHLTEQLA